LPAPAAALPRGTITDWELSDAFDATAFKPGIAPSLTGRSWERVHVEAPGFVLVNRYRRAPATNIPRDPATGAPLADVIMGGPIPGAKVVLARTVIQSDRAEVRRMLIGYTNGVEVYANGQPLFFGMNPIVQPAMSWMNMIGDGVYVPLKQGRNEVVFAVTDLTAGWGFWARLDP
jgi:ribosomal protein L34E